MAARAAEPAVARGWLVLWLNDARHRLPLAPSPAPDGARLLDVLAARGIAYTLRARAWRDPALGAGPLLERVGSLDGPLEIVVNGHLAPAGVAHLCVRPDDVVVIGQPAYLRQRFPFFV